MVRTLALEGFGPFALRTVADQPTFWERFSPKELLRLSMEPARVDDLLDNPIFLAPFERLYDPRGESEVDTSRPPRNLGVSVITKRIDTDRKLVLKGQLVARATQWPV